MLPHLAFHLLFLLPLLVHANPSPPNSAQTSAAPSIPPTPGNQKEDDDVCPNYKICGSKGLGYWNDLHTTLSDPKSKDRTDESSKFQQYYITNFANTRAADPDLYQDLINHGIGADHLDEWAIWGKDPETGLRGGPWAPYENVFDTNGGAIIASSNYREWDTQKQLQWEEGNYGDLDKMDYNASRYLELETSRKKETPAQD
ncbi:MAG: hypothetical protein Q9181_008011 [Wetmoreana brouardii]